jgi:hypothetical protein
VRSTTVSEIVKLNRREVGRYIEVTFTDPQDPALDIGGADVIMRAWKRGHGDLISGAAEILGPTSARYQVTAGDLDDALGIYHLRWYVTRGGAVSVFPNGDPDVLLVTD